MSEECVHRWVSIRTPLAYERVLEGTDNGFGELSP